MNVKNKRILITAGPTWVPIDSVRVISNIASGATGILLAERLERLGAKVTLFLGPGQPSYSDNNIRLIRFKFFNELKDLLIRELGTKKYDIVIHSAAVSDYKPKNYYRRKVKSGKKLWRLELVPAPKLIDSIKKIDQSILLVGFKFEPRISKAKLIAEARILIQNSEADLVAANTICNGHYNAYIVSQEKVSKLLRSRNEFVKILISKIGD